MFPYLSYTSVIFVVAIISYVCCFLVPDGKVSVQTPVGSIVGYSSVLNINGTPKVLHKFLGIPYAESPTGTKRFRKPVPKAAFRTTFDALDFGPACFQMEFAGTSNLIDQNIAYDEDCLFLNIYAPGRLPSDSHLYPVMVWIHGGGFVIGLSNIYDGGFLSLSGDVVVVTINYRLNVYGFLSTDDPNARGNIGLFDQHMAIKWVRDNIQSFGGDPSRITIFGESAGSASVAYQTIYSANKGLFQGAIAQSGSFTSPWAFMSAEKAKNQTRLFANAVGCLQTNNSILVKCMQQKPAAEVNKALNMLASEKGIAAWPPVEDGEFILDNPKELLVGSFPSQQVKNMFLSVDLIMGVNNKEGFVQYPVYNKSDNLDYNKSYIDEKLLPDVLLTSGFNDPLLPSIKSAVVMEYTDWDDLGDNNKQFNRFVDVVSDLSFFVPAAQTAQKHTMNTTRHTYVYELSAAPPFHFLPISSEIDGPTVANHGDDLAFIFGSWYGNNINIFGGNNLTVTDEQRRIGKAMITMWTNFAKSGDPNQPEDIKRFINTSWPEFNMASQSYINITPDLSRNAVQDHFANKQVQFWSYLIPAIEHAAKHSHGKS